MSSMTSHSIRKPASSRPEFVMVPVVLVLDTMDAVMSGGHWRRNTVGGTLEFSPKITPPKPWPEALVMPIKSGHPTTSAEHGIGLLIVSRRNVRQSQTAVRSKMFQCRYTVSGLIARTV